jgi:hypothetical protein
VGRKEPLRPKPEETLVEAAGQLFHLFRDGLDYAFILRIDCSCDRSGACYSDESES